MPNLVVFALAIAPFAATALIQELLLIPLLQANVGGEVAELSLLSRSLLWFADAHMQYMAWIFLIGPILIAVIAAANSRVRPLTAAADRRWHWLAAGLILFVASVFVALLVFRRSGDVALLLSWMASAAWAIALGDAFVTQKARWTAGRSSWSPGFVVALGSVASLIHPIFLAVVSIGPQFQSWREQRLRSSSTAG